MKSVSSSLIPSYHIKVVNVLEFSKTNLKKKPITLVLKYATFNEW